MDLLGELTLQNELQKLQDGQAIGNEKHQRQLLDLITEQRLLLAESLFCIACQTPLTKAETLKVFHYLRNVSPDEETGQIDQADLFVFFALLYSLNVSSLETQSELAANNGMFWNLGVRSQKIAIQWLNRGWFSTLSIFIDKLDMLQVCLLCGFFGGYINGLYRH